MWSSVFWCCTSLRCTRRSPRGPQSRSDRSPSRPGLPFGHRARHTSTISALNSGMNARRGRRCLPMPSIMNILPRASSPQISDVRQNGAGPVLNSRWDVVPVPRGRPCRRRNLAPSKVTVPSENDAPWKAILLPGSIDHCGVVSPVLGGTATVGWLLSSRRHASIGAGHVKSGSA
jgi:hypothetical protein